MNEENVSDREEVSEHSRGRKVGMLAGERERMEVQVQFIMEWQGGYSKIKGWKPIHSPLLLVH